MKTLRALPITAQNFAPYGWLLSADGQAGRAINEGNSQRVDGTGALQLSAEAGLPCLAIFRAQARCPQGPWRVLERHRLGSQSFVPLCGARYLVLVATGADAPHAHSLAAFVVAGHQAVTLHPGTWHHGLIALDGGDFVVLERSAKQVDCDCVELAEPVSLSLE